jgi:DNA-binding PadR family transcriptional regulator
MNDDDFTGDDEDQPAVGMPPPLPRWRSRQAGRGRRLAAGDVPATTRGTMYELYVLGELMEQPVHGYLLPQILSHILGPYRQMSWGALYPLIHRLVQDGLILPWEPVSGGNGRRRQAYAITEAGRARFRELMAEPGEYGTDYRELFSIKLSKFGYVDRLLQLGILRHYRGYVQELRAHLEEVVEHVADNPYISATERPGVLRSLSHRVRLVRADMQWIEQEIARTEDAVTGEPPGQAQS